MTRPKSLKDSHLVRHWVTRWESQAIFDSLSLQGGPITWAKEKRLQKALNRVVWDVIDVWNQAKLKDEHWLTWFGLIHHTTAPHDNLFEAVNLNLNNLPAMLRILYYNVLFLQIGCMIHVSLSPYIFVSYFFRNINLLFLLFGILFQLSLLCKP